MLLKEKVTIARRVAGDILEDVYSAEVYASEHTEGLTSQERIDIWSIITNAIAAELKGSK